MAIFSEVSENEFVKEAPPVRSHNLIDTARYLANGARQDVSYKAFDWYQNQ